MSDDAGNKLMLETTTTIESQDEDEELIGTRRRYFHEYCEFEYPVLLEYLEIASSSDDVQMMSAGFLEGHPDKNVSMYFKIEDNTKDSPMAPNTILFFSPETLSQVMWLLTCAFMAHEQERQPRWELRDNDESVYI